MSRLKTSIISSMAAVKYHRMSKRSLPLAVLLCICIFFFFINGNRWSGLLGGTSTARPDKLVPIRPDVELVVAKMKREDTTWIQKYLPEWKHSIYVVDNPKAELTVAVNKGREAMVYLTYMIDRYDSLPGTTVFIHANRFQWHNDNPDYDGLLSLRNISLPYIRQEGYVNLRCVWVLGCPAEIRPFDDDMAAQNKPAGEKPVTKDVFKKAFQEFMPDVKVPQAVGVPCCSQFAVTKETIRRRAREDYVRIKEWLVDTDLNDDLSGRVLEYAWHIIFGKESVHCPSPAVCYCKLYGLCDLECNEGGCDGRYVLPPFSSLPAGWPKKGWKGEDRTFESPF